jgi:hypothetical protein
LLETITSQFKPLSMDQGILTKGKGSVQLTSSLK